MPLIVITPLDTEPVSLGDVKEQCRVDNDDQDGLLTRLIQVARVWIEEITARALGEQTFELVLDRFPVGTRGDPLRGNTRVHESGRLVGPFIKIPRAPLIEIESITYIDEAGDSQTLDAADYLVDKDTVPARITPAFDTVWPLTQFRVNAVRVRFRAGYQNDSPGVDSPDSDFLPEPLRQALLLKVQSLYDGVDLGMTIDALINPYRIREF
jgi:hypothetical protein